MIDGRCQRKCQEPSTEQMIHAHTLYHTDRVNIINPKYLIVALEYPDFQQTNVH